MKEKYHHLPINQLHEYELNNKIHPEEQLQALDYSIQKVGFRAPILIDENNVILAGHARYQSVKRLGMKEVSVVQFFDLTEDQKEEYRLLDNIIAEKAEDNLKNIEIILKKLDIPELTALYADKDLNLQMIDIKLNRTLNILDIIGENEEGE